MADYNLNALNPREFEHLIQSLTFAVIGNGVTPFGDGPDGGREATYSGRTSYKSHENIWEGYVVIQCKFNIKPTGNTTQDGDWALNELKKELDKYLDQKRKIPKPDYFIFVTNVTLSAVLDTGGIDKVNRHLEKQKNEIGYKDWDIWDYNKICRLLDNNESVRKKYLAFISSGDVLSEILSFIKMENKNFDNLMSQFIQKEFLAEQYVKLEQAGHSSENKTAIANVFVDLPATRTEVVESFKDSELEKISTDIVSEILNLGTNILKRSHFLNESLIFFENELQSEPGRFVVVGGPGQGKSTIGQFLCQLYRSAILSSRKVSEIIPEVVEDLKKFIVNCEKESICIPTVKRFPFRIVLDQFADALAKNEVKSLVSYIQHRIEHKIDQDLTQSILENGSPNILGL